MIGEGKYDELASLVRERAKAQGAAVIIVGGNKGHGFSCQLTAEAIKAFPGMLRKMADEIEKDQEKI